MLATNWRAVVLESYVVPCIAIEGEVERDAYCITAYFVNESSMGFSGGVGVLRKDMVA